MKTAPSKRQAFTLIELAIVLVIIGLIVGGVLVGRDLIKAAELRAIVTELTRYQTAVNTFRGKYDAFPGDMNNATSIWGTAASCPGNETTPSTTAATCNGDGDGSIYVYEWFRFWQQLANANLIEGKYTGVNAVSGNVTSANIGSNVPASKLASAGWFMMPGWGAVTEASVDLFEGSYTNMFILGTTGAGGNYTEWGAFTASDGFKVDQKIDDGKPGVGMMRVFERQTSCHDAGTSTGPIANTANYAITNKIASACTFFFTLK